MGCGQCRQRLSSAHELSFVLEESQLPTCSHDLSLDVGIHMFGADCKSQMNTRRGNQLVSEVNEESPGGGRPREVSWSSQEDGVSSRACHAEGRYTAGELCGPAFQACDWLERMEQAWLQEVSRCFPQCVSGLGGRCPC